MKNFADQIRQEIQNQEISPIPKWVFVLKNVAFALCFLVSIFLGGLALSLILYFIFEGGFEHQKSPIVGFIQSLPLLWVISFGVFSVFAVWGMKHLPKGYKVSTGIFIGGNIFLTLLLGAGLYTFDFPEEVERYSMHIPFHNSLEKRLQQQWSRPENGYLGGFITDIDIDTKQMFITDFENKQWTITFDSHLEQNRIFVREKDIRQNKEDLRKPPIPIFPQSTEGKKIRIEGQKIDDKTFKATNIYPWKRSLFKPCRGSECQKIGE